MKDTESVSGDAKRLNLLFNGTKHSRKPEKYDKIENLDGKFPKMAPGAVGKEKIAQKRSDE